VTRRGLRHVLLGCAALAVWGLSADGVTAARTPVTHTVNIDGSRFEPETLSVVGDTVVWVNKDLVAHTATSKTGVFDSGASLRRVSRGNTNPRPSAISLTPTPITRR
jgi:plastocyanin